MKRVLFFLAIFVSLMNSQSLFAQVVVPSAIHFGNQGDGTSSNPIQVTFINPIDAGPIQIASIAFSSGVDFTLSNNTCSPLPFDVSAAGSCTFEIAFSPVTIGALSDTLTITGSASSFSLTVSVDGMGVGIANATPSPTSLNFGEEVEGASSSPQNVTITNEGTADLNVLGFVLGGTNPNNFDISNDTCIGTPLAPNSTCQFSVVYNPVGIISGSTAFVSIISDATNEVPLISLTGGAGTPFYNGGCTLSSRPQKYPFSLLFGLIAYGGIYFALRRAKVSMG